MVLGRWNYYHTPSAATFRQDTPTTDFLRTLSSAAVPTDRQEASGLPPKRPGTPAAGGIQLTSATAPDTASAIQPLHLFAPVLGDPCGQACTALLRHLAAGRPGRAAAAYGRLFHILATEGWAGDAWAAHLAEAVATCANPFTLAAVPASGLTAAACSDLERLERLAHGGVLEAAVATLVAAGYAAVPAWDLGPRRPQGVAGRLASSGGWPKLAEALRRAALAGGAGPFAAAQAWRWAPGADGRRGPQPIAHPDLPGELYGYEAERAQVTANTERFLSGLPSNDILLYGDRGTGKSSTVKALLRHFADRGLRLLELSRRNLPDLPEVCARLADQPQRFIVFVDDLSFGADDGSYRDAKAALQGGLVARPPNVRVYATSNRRHLLQERFADRPRPDDDDPRAGDAVEEMLSLADRFGLTVVFPAPDQALYLEIVSHLAAEAGLDLPAAELRTQALRWAVTYNGRSGRGARQFIDAIAATAGA